MINDEIDEVIHQRVRLSIMSVLIASREQETEFNALKEQLSLTDGNLSTHLSVLEQHGYVEIEKHFVGKKPKTWVRLSTSGQVAFQRYVATLEAIIRPQLQEAAAAEREEAERERELAAHPGKLQTQMGS